MKKLKLLKLLRLPFLVIESMFDKEFLAPDVPMSKMASHQKWREYLYEIRNNPRHREMLKAGA